VKEMVLLDLLGDAACEGRCQPTDQEFVLDLRTRTVPGEKA
jgi:hypothetical protein